MSEEVSAVQESKIREFYAGASVFITGATGFLGKLLVEKLLRTCPDIEKVYVLIREKKGKSIEKRLEESLENPVFDVIKRQFPKFADKIEMVRGDCVEEDLGLSIQDKEKLLSNVKCVFHCAATVRFDEKMRTASYINVRATRDILKLAKEMPKLKAAIYVSTAFSQCIRENINEEFYETPITGENLLSLVEASSDELLEKITPVLLGKWPNTYAYTKAIAEEIVESYGKGLPVAIVRPSIVAATSDDPVSGWIDNMYGATGATVGVALGLVRTMHVNKECLADIIPADYVISCTVAAAWSVGTKDATPEPRVPIFNCVTSVEKPINWKNWMKYSEKHLKQVPSHLQVWNYFFFMNSNAYMHMICTFLLHTIPAYIVDFLAKCVGKEPLLVKGYQKINKFLNVLAYFTTRTFIFTNHNTQNLWKKLDAADKKMFNFDVSTFDWDEYFYKFARGGRVYLLKDPLDTLPQGRAKFLKLKIAHYTLLTILLLLTLKFLLFLWNLF
ncbi:hypothetical protein RN001_010402 [Aquatica leii]|uniref:Fatty acyl-CoA reductase n=1 Tax=Aquatica leii TaxID=1421715 RepID=A0AAN7P9W6_9COLE|nr:hypothetical protein RN001_010402 [Aquatica leii]